MSDPENVAVAELSKNRDLASVQAMMRALSSFDLQRFGAGLSETVRWRYMCTGARYAGFDTKHRILEAMQAGHDASASGISVETRGIHACGQTIVAEGISRALLHDGKRYENAVCFVFVMRNGLAEEVREYMDSAHAYDVWG